MSCATKGSSDIEVLPELNLFSAALDSSGKLFLYGELDVSGIDALRVVLDQALLEPGNEIVVNGSRLASIDLPASRELLEYQTRAASSRRRLWLEPVSIEVTKALRGFNLLGLLIKPKERVGS